jgi:outer membrane protein assembly factor BamE (lipoprotein component of BamABCDE complex)
VVLMLCAFCLAACGSQVNQANFDKVQIGMTMAQVTAILGSPRNPQA